MTLSQRRLNRALLARQLLLERSRMPIGLALQRVGGLQAQYAPSPYIRLWSMLERLRARRPHARARAAACRAGDADAVDDPHRLAADYWRFAAGIGPARQEWWLRAWRLEHRGLDLDAVATHASRRARRAHLAPRRSSTRSSATRARRSGRAPGSSSSASRRPARGSVGAPTSSGSPTSGSTRGRHRGRRARAPPAAVPRRLRPGAARSTPPTGWACRARSSSRSPSASSCGASETRTASSSSTSRVRRFPARGHAGARAVPRHLGRGACSSTRADADPPRALSPARLPHEEPAVGRHVPRRRRRSRAPGGSSAPAAKATLRARALRAASARRADASSATKAAAARPVRRAGRGVLRGALRRRRASARARARRAARSRSTSTQPSPRASQSVRACGFTDWAARIPRQAASAGSRRITSR